MVEAVDYVRGLVKSIGKIVELYEVRTFRGWRETATLPAYEVIIEIQDNPDMANRYSVRVTRCDDGRMATGNPSNKMDVALFGVHWNEIE